MEMEAPDTTKSRFTKSSEKFLIRLPTGMRESISQAAKASRRSMNSEIISRLGDSLTRPSLSQTVNINKSSDSSQHMIAAKNIQWIS